MANSLEELISQIKDRLDIVDVVSQQVVLKKDVISNACKSLAPNLSNDEQIKVSNIHKFQ